MSFRYTDFANGLWDSTANAQGRVEALSDTLTLLAIDTATYVADRDADVTLADIPGAAILATQPLTGVIVTAAGLTCDPVDFGAIAAGPDVGAVVLYKDTGTPTTSPLMLYLDDAATGLPATPNGTDSVVVNPGAGGLATL